MRINFFTPDYRLPDSFYNETSTRKFRWGLLKWATIFGLIGAYLSTDSSYFSNDLNMRPDFNSRRAMIPIENIPLKERKVLEIFNGNYFGTEFKETNQSIWKRGLNFFYPYHNYDPHRAYNEPFFDYKKDYVIEQHKSHYHFNI